MFQVNLAYAFGSNLFEAVLINQHRVLWHLLAAVLGSCDPVFLHPCRALTERVLKSAIFVEVVDDDPVVGTNTEAHDARFNRLLVDQVLRQLTLIDWHV